MNRTSAGFGLRCPHCNFSVGMRAVVTTGAGKEDAEICPNCGKRMVADEQWRAQSGFTCPKCGTQIGMLVGNGPPVCPVCRS